MGPTWGPSGADRTQVGPILAPWTLLSGIYCTRQIHGRNIGYGILRRLTHDNSHKIGALIVLIPQLSNLKGPSKMCLSYTMSITNGDNSRWCCCNMQFRITSIPTFTFVEMIVKPWRNSSRYCSSMFTTRPIGIIRRLTNFPIGIIKDLTPYSVNKGLNCLISL